MAPSESTANPLRNYAIVTGGYWAFTVTDGALPLVDIVDGS